MIETPIRLAACVEKLLSALEHIFMLGASQFSKKFKKFPSTMHLSSQEVEKDDAKHLSNGTESSRLALSNEKFLLFALCFAFGCLTRKHINHPRSMGWSFSCLKLWKTGAGCHLVGGQRGKGFLKKREGRVKSTKPIALPPLSSCSPAISPWEVHRAPQS